MEENYIPENENTSTEFKHGLNEFECQSIESEEENSTINSDSEKDQISDLMNGENIRDNKKLTSTENDGSDKNTNINDADSDSSICPSSNLSNEFVLLKEQNKALQSCILKLQKENARLEADRSAELHAIQLESLEKTISQQKKDIEQLQESFRKQADISQKHLFQLKQEYESKIDRLNKKYEIANKERESMVMKYAVSEKSVIDLKRDIQTFENKIKDFLKDKEVMQNKIKALSAEKAKVQQLLDSKMNEMTLVEREIQKKKDEIQMRDSKIKWAQNRLKTEMDNHAETQNKLEKLQQKFTEAREETEQFKKHTQAMIKNYQEVQEHKHNQEQQEKAKLIIDKHDEETLAKLQLEIDNYKTKQKSLIEENNHLSLKIQNIEKQRLEYEYNLSKMKQVVDCEKRTAIDLVAQLSEFESTKLLLLHEQERLIACQNEMERLRKSNTDLQQEMESCREREAELLEFTQKLTEKNVRLQSEFTAIEARGHQLQIEHSSCKLDLNNLESTNAFLTKELEREKNQRQEERELITKRLAEQLEKSDFLARELADLQVESQLLKKKNLVTVKELSKELVVCRKRLETYESSNANLSMGDGSRTSSSASLNTMEVNENKSNFNQALPANSLSLPVELDPQALINKIIEVQKSNARKTEKLEFLKEHVKQLVIELQKKSKIIQNYIVREQSGALSSETMDKYKAALAKHGGIMSSVYNSKAVDEGMTLEFSLKINKKLQAVLEDTLLKNITLKENLETLGNEIARLTAAEESKVKS